jgi:hypothetical protein
MEYLFEVIKFVKKIYELDDLQLRIVFNIILAILVYGFILGFLFAYSIKY